ncbi:MAG: hypothetical protein COV91_04265 [Candidatus Taylorbacteria bacterium CG11_big_fil_rev_8_21_14_0_20_46_11]|uniref:Uncharacterized protein n=1 Tax=Candidatus Taylorbacteria bacterium CG11_big_fil_rev_8_21_14_0_20_46_11 TaxID=1975025 RepID=A0A2H0KCU7_9BACT|nr:MAG: hypothetical protein COV91_04265 [Candidatus Taylorbacteria bacterium CG11_big_fil_rev_8_21_14_0_20_46_11]
MKLESLVIAGQQTAVNTFSSLVLRIKCAGQVMNLDCLNQSLQILESSERVINWPRGRLMKDPSSKKQPIQTERDTTYVVSHGEVSEKPRMGCKEENHY